MPQHRGRQHDHEAGQGDGLEQPDVGAQHEAHPPADPPAARPPERPERIFIEGRQFRHTADEGSQFRPTAGGRECVATPPMAACPCGAFPHLEWSYSHL